MKKILLGTAASLFLVSANAADEACGCTDTSFTGAFIGVSADFSFDKGEIESVVKDNDDGSDAPTSKYGKKNKHKTAFGGSIILGYGYQHSSGLYMSIFHESSFLSKAEMTYSKTIPFEDVVDAAGVTYTGSDLKYSRKVYVPSFGIGLGYVVDNFGFGLRGGVSIEKVKLERGAYTVDYTAPDVDDMVAVAREKSETITSPFIGAYVEYKMGGAVAFLNLDYKFSKKKNVTFDLKTADGDNVSGLAPFEDNENGYTQHVTHKRPSLKLSIGVKANINNLLAKFN